MAKFTLKFEEEYPYVVYGMSSTAADYRLCWALNKQMGIALKRKAPLRIQSNSGEIVEHAFFEHNSDLIEASFRLIENKRGASRVLKEVEQADYLLVLDQHPELNTENLLSEIKKLRPVLLAFTLDLDRLKNKQNLLLTA